MVKVQTTVFISYRRNTGQAWALAIYQDLTQHGYEVFLDHEGIGSGDFERVIVEHIKGCAHFLALLTPSTLDRADGPGDWFRNELELAIQSQSNIVPVMLDGCSFDEPSVATHLVGVLSPLKPYNALTMHSEYFPDAMTRLRERYLTVELDTVRPPISPVARNDLHGAIEDFSAAIQVKPD